MNKYFLLKTAMLLGICFTLSNAQNSWQSIGPNGGYIRCIVKDNIGRILAGNAYGGIFRTSDAGQNWEQVFNGYRNEDVRSLAVNSNNHLFAGTDGHGLFRSTDDGDTWQRLNNLIFTSTVMAILITSSGDIFAGTFNGLYRSTDNGTTFSLSGNGISGTTIRAIGYSSGFLFAGSDFNGVFRSSDNGNSWEAVNNGIDYSSRLIECFASTDFISDGANKIYVGASDKMYSSSNIGISWDEIPTPQRNFSDLLIRSNGNIVASASSNVTTAGGGIIESSNEGNSWQVFNLPNIPFSSVKEDNNDKLIGGSHGPGTYVTINNTDWNLEVTGMPAVAINGINHTSGVITVSTRHSGSFVTDNEGLTWENVSNSLPYGWNYEFKINPVTNTAFLLHQNGTYKTTYGEWNNWTNTNIFANTIGFNSLGHGFLFNGAFCYKTTDDGSTFQPINIGNINYVRQVALDEADNIYIATANDFGNNGNGVWRSTDAALTWQPINANLPLNITAIASVEYNGPEILDCEREIIAGTSDGKGFSLNDNLSWNEFSVGFTTNQFVKDIATISYTDGFDVSFLSEDAMKYHLGPGVNPGCFWYDAPEVSEIDIFKTVMSTGGFNFFKSSKNNNTVEIVKYIGTLGAGIYKRVFSTDIDVTDDIIPDAFNLSQNYPNPFNPSTTIRFSIPEHSFVKLEIFNTLGEKVTTLVSEELNAGNYKYEWSAGNYPSGIYFYRLSANTFSKVNKMIFLK